jgi:hypothetical protein
MVAVAAQGVSVAAGFGLTGNGALANTDAGCGGPGTYGGVVCFVGSSAFMSKSINAIFLPHSHHD